MTLLALQRDFRDWLHVGEDRQAACFPPSARPGLAVYQNNFRGQIAACLGESFPVTRSWLGGEAFHKAIVVHAERTPPSSWTLDAYPCDFPHTLGRLYPDDREVAELAWLELALAEAFVAADAVPISADALACIDWEHAVLELAPSLQIQPISTNAPAIWSALAGETSPPAAEQLTEPAALLIWRQGERSRFRTTDRAEADALSLIRSGSSFGALCTGLAEASDGDLATAAAASWLAQWITDELIIGTKGETTCTA
ncbi:MAG: DNA-binding domain-containing protein [Sphingomonadales bacterium]|nr:DNA-binding domain-containing protein [Sphingomonadales bacterium]